MKSIKHDVIIVGSGLTAVATAARLRDNPHGDTPLQYFEDMMHA